MILFFIGIVILGMMLGAKNPDVWTYTVLAITLFINVLLVVRAANLHFAEMELMFGDKVFEDFYKTLSENRVEGLVKSLYNIKWTVMVIPGIFYIYQILRINETKASHVVNIHGSNDAERYL